MVQNKYFFKTLQEELKIYGSKNKMKHKTIEDLLLKGTREEILRVHRTAIQGYQAIDKKYGSMLDYAKNHPDMEQCNNEMVRRDKLLYKFTKRYAK